MKTRITRAFFAAIVAVAGRAAARLTAARLTERGRGGRGIRVSLIAVVFAVFAAAALPQAAQAQTQAADIAFLRAKAENTDSTLVRIDKTLGRMNEKLVDLEKVVVRLDERVNGLQMQNQFFVIPLLLLTLAAFFALLTKGHYWGVDREPKASRRGGVAQPAASPA